jgi:predicted secreted protein
MPKAAGRQAVVSRAGTAIASVRVSTISINNEPIDVTDRDSAGIVELLAVPATRQITLSVEGLVNSAVLRDAAIGTGSPLLTDVTFTFADALPAVDVLTCNFFITNYEETNPHDDASEFSCEFVSSGPWTRA